MTSRAQELAKMLGRTSSMQPTTFTNRSTYASTGTGTGDGVSRWSYVYGFGITLVILFIVLLIVHYTIRPIFPKNVWPWEQDIPFLSPKTEYQLAWENTPSLSETPAGFLKLIPYGFTVSQDIMVKPSTAVGKVSRVFLYRSSKSISVDMNPEMEDLITTYPETNLFMYLASDTNDLTVSVVTGTNDVFKLESTPTILNVPVGKPFRVTVVLLANLLEVYLNGRLFGTEMLKGMPRMISADFFGPPEGIRNTVQTMNLQYWDRALDAKEIMNNSLPLPDSSLFGLQMTAACPGGVLDTISQNVQNLGQDFTEGVQQMFT